MLFEGIFLPLTTPFYPDGRLYTRKLQSNVGRYSLTPAAGMLMLTDAAEADSLTDEECRAVLETATAAAAKEKVMIAAVGRESVFATLTMAEVAANAGYDAIAVRAPLFAEDPALRVELMTYFRAVADAVSLPVLLVSTEGRTLNLDAIAELAEHPQIVGILDAGAGAERVTTIKARTASVSHEAVVTTIFAAATRRMLRASDGTSNLGGVAVLGTPAIKTRVKKVGFQVLTGATAAMLECWQAGASGAVPRLGPAAPQACCEVWQAFKDGDPALAEEKQERVRLIAGHVEGPAGIGALKHGCYWNGYFGGRPRLPLLSLTAAGQAEVELELTGMRN